MRRIPGPGEKSAGRHGNQTYLNIGVDMDTLFMLSYLQVQIARVLIALFVFMLLRKYLLPMIAREVKIDLLIIIVLLYLLFLASFKIWPVW